MTILFDLLFSRAGLLAIAIGAMWWWHVEDKAAAIAAHDQAAQAVRTAEVLAFDAQLATREAELRAQVAAAAAKVRVETVTLQKEVVRYVTPAADARCIVPVGFVQHHDAAWGLPGFPAAAGGSVDDPSGFPLSRVESVNTDNAGAAREWQAEALAWRSWFARNRPKFDAFAAKPAGAAP